MSKQRIRIIGKKKFNEETKTVSIRVPISRYNEIKNLVKLLVNNILKEKQIRIQIQGRNGIIKDIFNEIKNPNEKEIQSQEIIDLKKGFSKFSSMYNKLRKKTNNSISGLLSAEGVEEILNEVNFDLIKKLEKNINLEEKIKKLYKEFESLPRKGRYGLGSKGTEILNKIHKLEIRLEKSKKGNPNNREIEKNPKIKRIHPLRVKSDITAIKGYLSHVPLDIAPNDDKGVYFTKAQQFVESLIKKYEKLTKKSNPNNPEITEKNLKNFKEEIYSNMLEIFDLLHDIDKLETFLSYLTEKEREKLYSHELLDEFDLLP